MELEMTKSCRIIRKFLSFIFNALQDGWKVQKKNENYIFSSVKVRLRSLYGKFFG